MEESADPHRRASDIRNARPTLPIHLAYLHGTSDDHAVLDEILSHGGEESGYERMADVLERTGALVRANQFLDEYLARAQDIVGALPASDSRRWFTALTENLALRDLTPQWSGD